MKIQVNLSNELLEKLDYICKSLGVSRSAFCALWIGQGVMSYGKAMETLDKIGFDAVETAKLTIQEKLNEDTKD